MGNELSALLPTSVARSNKAEFICKMATTLQQSGDMELLRAAHGLLRYLNTEGADLEECLGLKARQGGRYETPWREAERNRLERTVKDLARFLPGPVAARAGKLSDWLKAGQTPADADPEVAALFRQLLTQYPNLPKSDRQLQRILKGETITGKTTR